MKNVGKAAPSLGRVVSLLDSRAAPCRSGHPASGSGLFYSILGFRLGCGLLLHVLRGIGTATLQRYDVIHHISRTVPGRRSC